MPAPKKKPTVAAKKKKAPAKVMDVARPGKTVPSASSKPVIVGHRPTVKDPMVNEGKDMPVEDPSSEEHKIEVKRTGPKVIAPLSTAEEIAKELQASEDADAAAPPESDTPQEPAVTEAEPEVEATPEPEAPAEEAPTPEPQPQSDSSNSGSSSDKSSSTTKTKETKDKGSSTVDAVAETAVKKKDDKQAAELERRAAEVDKLVDEKKYFVHTSHTTKTQRKTRWLLLVLLIVLLAGAYAAIDAQVIKNDIQLPYEFFKEAEQQDTSATPPVTAPQQAAEPEETEEEKQAEAAKELDTKRKNELKKMQAALETYFNDNGFYPSLEQLNDATFRAANVSLKDITADDLTDPEGTTAAFVGSPTPKAYSYEPNPVKCGTADVPCTDYVMMAVLSGKDDPDANEAGYYQLNSVNQ